MNLKKIYRLVMLWAMICLPLWFIFILIGGRVFKESDKVIMFSSLPYIIIGILIIIFRNKLEDGEENAKPKEM